MSCFADGKADTVIWSPNINPFALVAHAIHIPIGGDVGILDISRFGTAATLFIAQDHRQHLLLSDQYRHLQIVISEGTLLEGPVRLRFIISGMKRLKEQALALQRFHAFYRTGQFPSALYPIERRAPRWRMMLQAWDGRQAGASQREIAEVLYGHRTVAEDWSAGFLRTRVQRLLRGADRLVHGGYLDILQGRSGMSGRRSAGQEPERANTSATGLSGQEKGF
ncbi:DUF2285 domain-containing protein [Thalassospira xiamenensis]|uniref:DUF2285 domain-containing protein n=1 Tax=Thalassospira xiamenensis TaxID=220697 RepID=UPI0007A3A9EA|nr:DUF2285 domain-containing protein [Thalassospira xiamenensis]KZB56359.1 hypothetical protein AUP41_14765 [Thalassospira xiamenensis]MCK2167195.1 DUF2285 domain-containing protein [Thalassospira xiamenensis]